MAEKLSLVDMIGIGNLLEPLVAEDIITCEERDRIILRIAKDNEIDEYRLSVLAGYKRSKAEVLARMEQRKQSKPQHKKQDDSYISLTELARNHSKNTPGYVIQSWLRSENTLAFLNLWEQENNPDYREAGYIELLEKKKTGRGDGFAITSSEHQVRILSSTETGLLYGAYSLLRMQAAGQLTVPLSVTEQPAYDLRILNHWDNPDGKIGRASCRERV